MSDDASALEVLKWAVAPERPTPQTAALDEDALFDLAAYHRILQPLLARLEASRPAWCSPRLRTRLRIAQHEVRRQTQRKIAAACEITRAMQKQGLTAPIFIKGFTAYALTGDPALLHFSGDLDPFAPDLPAFWDALHALGYAGRRKDTHEWAKLRRGEITLDVHQHYPVLSYPADVRTASAEELSPHRNPGRWHLPMRAETLGEEEQIRWADLAAEATPGRVEGTEGLLFPSPTLMCLIHCAHRFRSAVTRLHYLNPLAGFNLYELLSIASLTRHPAFQPSHFRALTARFSAQDAVRHVNALARAFLGTEAVPGEADQASSMPTFREHLIFGGWVSLLRPDDFLRRRGIEQILTDFDARVFPARCALDAAEVPRLITHGTPPPLPRVELVWEFPERMLTVDWSFREAARHGCELLVHFGYDSVRVTLNAANEVVSLVQKSDYLGLDRQAVVLPNAKSGVRMACPVPAVPTRPVPEAVTDLPLFLAMRLLSLDGRSTEAACYLPLRLSR